MGIFIILFIFVVMVLAFKFQPYTVLSDSQAPYFTQRDIIVVKQQKEYKTGDIVKFNNETKDGIMPVTHRLIAIVKDDRGVEHFICHGDNVQNTDGTYDHIADYKWEINRLKDKVYNWITANCINIQDVNASKVEGKVVAIFKNYGIYYNFITEYKVLMIAIVLGLWCFSYTMQNELEIKKSRRLL